MSVGVIIGVFVVLPLAIIIGGLICILMYKSKGAKSPPTDPPLDLTALGVLPAGGYAPELNP